MLDFLSNFKIVLMALAIGDTLGGTYSVRLVCNRHHPSSHKANLGNQVSKIVWRAQKVQEK